VLDPVRLAVLGASVGDPAPIDSLAEQLDVPRRTIAKAVGSLRSDGLLDPDGKADVAVLRAVAESIPTKGGGDEPVEGPWTEEESVILGRFFEGGRLRTIPTHASKRFLVLEKVAQEFEPGKRYSEREVNFKIQLIHSDYAAIRRYMVDGGLMDRADGAYWRTGGRYAIPDERQADEFDDRSLLDTALDGVVLRAYTWEMADALVVAADDERISTYMSDSFASPYTLEAANGWIAAASTDSPTTHYAIFDRGILVGGVGSSAFNDERAGTSEIGWWLSPQVWGRGLATAAAKALIDELFGNRDVARVWAPVMHPNISSARVAVKIGLLLEGTAPEAYVKGGTRYDQLNYGLTRSQWQARR
jgi:RimJ/RimL family protein N-acetyltransferase